MEQQFKIITTLAEHERSRVCIALDSSDHPVILKKYSEKTPLSLIRRIAGIDSPYFPKIYEIAEEGEGLRVVEEYIEGTELGRLLHERRLSENEACSFMKQLIEALHILHKMDPPLIHRDIKPANILITPDMKLKLLDFDAAREWHDDDRSSDTRLLGTVGYAAPEQFGYSQTDCRTDLYSAGIVCSQICENSDLAEDKRRRLKSFTDRATMFDPVERFQSAEEMAEALENAADDNDRGEAAFNTVHTATENPSATENQSATENPSAPESLPDAKRRKKAFFVLPVIAACLLIGIKVFLGLSSRSTSFYDLDVLPDEYSYKSIRPRLFNLYDDPNSAEMRYPGLIPVNESSSGPPVILFSKKTPRSFLFYDYRLEDKSYGVFLDRYSSDESTIEDRLTVRSRSDLKLQNGILCLPVEFLNRLKDGTYKLRIESGEDYKWEYRLVIKDADHDDPAYPLMIPAPIQYYSTSIRNDVLFTFCNTGSKLAQINCNGERISKRHRIMTKDGYGVVLPAGFFENTDTSSGKIELEFIMKNGKKTDATVFIIP
ncbi:MAG: serine/threonine protein kinase [Lachnospiraceae bacterium]|nr:serine/threonine protein kinase [Lachnospiraceae bacterium]